MHQRWDLAVIKIGKHALFLAYNVTLFATFSKIQKQFSAPSVSSKICICLQISTLAPAFLCDRRWLKRGRYVKWLPCELCSQNQSRNNMRSHSIAKLVVTTETTGCGTIFFFLLNDSNVQGHIKHWQDLEEWQGPPQKVQWCKCVYPLPNFLASVFQIIVLLAWCVSKLEVMVRYSHSGFPGRKQNSW